MHGKESKEVKMLTRKTLRTKQRKETLRIEPSLTPTLISWKQLKKWYKLQMSSH